MNGYTGSGVILLDKKNNIMMLGIDYKNEISDFGGQIDKNEKIVETASRELFEETCSVINFDKNIISNSNSIDIDRFNHKYRCYIVEYDNINFDSDVKLFNINKQKIKDICCTEMKFINIFNIDNIKDIYKQQKLTSDPNFKFIMSKRLEKILDIYFSIN